MDYFVESRTTDRSILGAWLTRRLLFLKPLDGGGHCRISRPLGSCILLSIVTFVPSHGVSAERSTAYILGILQDCLDDGNARTIQWLEIIVGGYEKALKK